jgi:hypothetical protein
VLDTGAVANTGAVSNKRWQLYADLFVQTAGATALLVPGRQDFVMTGITNPYVQEAASSGISLSPLNLTVANLYTIYAAFGTSSGSNAISLVAASFEHEPALSVA